jgi:hypothetical protein
MIEANSKWQDCSGKVATVVRCYGDSRWVDFRIEDDERIYGLNVVEFKQHFQPCEEPEKWVPKVGDFVRSERVARLGRISLIGNTGSAEDGIVTNGEDIIRVAWIGGKGPVATNFSVDHFMEVFRHVPDEKICPFKIESDGLEAGEAEIVANSVCTFKNGPEVGEQWESQGTRYLILRADDRHIEFIRDSYGASKETLKTMIFMRDFQKVKDAVPSIEDNVKRIADALENINYMLSAIHEVMRNKC